MMYLAHYRLPMLFLLVFLLSLGGCTTIAEYDQVAYKQATDLKVESLSLMDKATKPYSTQKNVVEELKVKIDKAYEYAKGRPNNEIITKQWSIMEDPSRHLLGGFLAQWKEKGRLSQTFITEVKDNVSDGFDEIIGLESGLIKSDENE